MPMTLSLMAGPIAVIDVETTGLYPFRHDRVVEVAVVVLGADLSVEREFVSLVNPGRDIGPSSIHGLTSEDILFAPQFGEIAAQILEVLAGTVAVAGHNIHFDLSFLQNEYLRLGQKLPDCFSVCTMRLAGGGKLADCCDDYDISIEGKAHHALADARATARLLVCLFSDGPREVEGLRTLTPIHWPTIPNEQKKPVTRDESQLLQTEPPSFLQRLLLRMDDPDLPADADGAVMEYWALLDRVLEDRHVDDSEGDALLETAARWGLGGDQIRLAHRNYLDRLAAVAVADGITTDAERDDLKRVARLLGQENRDLDEILSEAEGNVFEALQSLATNTLNESSLFGKSVCFTGELQGKYRGQMISRQQAEELAADAGLMSVDSVTKKLDLLVLADPYSQSGKAKRARKYSVRIMQEIVFWRAIGLDVE